MENRRISAANKLLYKLRSWSLDLEFLPHLFKDIPYLSDRECKKLSVGFPFTWLMLRRSFPHSPRRCSVNNVEGGYRYKLYEGARVIYQLDLMERLSKEDVQAFINNPQVFIRRMMRPPSVL